MKDSIPPLLRTGFDTLHEKPKIDAESPLGKRLIGLVCVLIRRASMTAATYVEHSKRKMITPNDIVLALKHEAIKFASDKGLETLEEEMENMNPLLESSSAENGIDIDEVVDGQIDEEEDDEEDEEEDEEDEDEEGQECDCETCRELRNVDWEAWQPTDPAQAFIKTALDNTMHRLHV
jgi:hypothetical protein